MHRRKLDNRYKPHGDQQQDTWKGKAFGLASSTSRRRAFDPRKARGELFYGERRPLNLDKPPEDPHNSLLHERRFEQKKQAPTAAQQKKRKRDDASDGDDKKKVSRAEASKKKKAKKKKAKAEL